MVVRGEADAKAPGASACSAHDIADASTRSPARIGVCCSRAIGILSESEAAAFLRTTSSKLAALEVALHGSDATRVTALSAETVSFFGQDLDKATLAAKVSWIARTSSLLHETCRVGLFSRELLRGWSADCVGLRVSGAEAQAVTRYYEFGDFGLLELVREPKPAVRLVAPPIGSASAPR
jgi:hypothetical protein